MKKFKINYNSGLYNAFSRVEEFEDYETAVRVVKELNEYGVAYPDLIEIYSV